jgi:hypothetical protein
MSKHPLDHDRGASSSRLAKFAAVERSEQPSAASKTLQQRPRTQSETRAKQFARIEREMKAVAP